MQARQAHAFAKVMFLSPEEIVLASVLAYSAGHFKAGEPKVRGRLVTSCCWLLLLKADF